MTIGLVLMQYVYAQSDNFKTYTNKDLGFSIAHPSNWKVHEEEPNTELYPEDLGFASFEIADRVDGFFSIDVEKVKTFLDTDTMTLQNTSAQQYAQEPLENYPKTERALNSGYSFIRQNEFTVGGITGWKIEFNLFGQYWFEIFTVANGRLYDLTYHDDPLKVPETLPLVNKMVDSFQIKTENEDTNNNLIFEGKSNISTFDDYEKKYCPEYSDELKLLVLCPPHELKEPQDDSNR